MGPFDVALSRDRQRGAAIRDPMASAMSAAHAGAPMSPTPTE
jgi:hypothetical protein